MTLIDSVIGSNNIVTYDIGISSTGTEEVLRIDNSRRGAVHVLWNFSRTKIARMSCDRSNERAFSACVDANGILINLELKERHI